MAEVLTIQDEEKKLIQDAYRQLLRSIKSEMDEDDRKMIRKAYEMAVQAHAEQRRKSGEPTTIRSATSATASPPSKGGFSTNTAPTSS